METEKTDVVVIGGGAAGLSGALMLARARRSVVVIDAGEPRNAPAAGIHGLLGHEGLAPRELVARGRAEVATYGGRIVDDTVTGVRGESGRFEVTLASGRGWQARQLLVAGGVRDRLPEIPGLAQHWGGAVVHCPYCHGWEVRDRPIAVVGTGPMSFHGVQLFRQWTDDLHFVRHDAPEPAPEQRRLMDARGIVYHDARIEEVLSDGAGIAGLRLDDGTVLEREILAVGTLMEARADYLADVGLEPVPHVSGMGVHLAVDPQGRTSVPGVWAAGNVADLSAQVGAAAAAGALAGAMINMDLVVEEGAAAVAAYETGPRGEGR
ncbi:NAD(P)/FAD-dependent oxidoreductase [Nocardioides daejeonensis]|uniref:NAD(P)/FAD-dependent oxidoreductase n=1 Tax=Nocardioides daejeonensis TaxID=1046556 RepID=UPI000D74C4BB|nr:NAD(P)/FAD-dependent oxidoreductase [Nocardioides daejeonensis]